MLGQPRLGQTLLAAAVLVLSLGSADAARADEHDAKPERPAAALPLIPVPEVAVTATRGERDVLEVPGNVTVLDRETIEASGARDVADLLRREAGLFVTRRGVSPESYTVEARGFNNGSGGGSATLVLVDGRRVNEPSSTVPDWGFLPTLDNVERIEVTRGPASALYGDNAQAGVIQIFTRRPEGGPRAILTGRTGTFDSDAGSLWLGGSEGAIAASAFLESYNTDGFRDRGDFRSNHGEMRLAYTLGDRARIGLSGGYSSQSRKRPGTLEATEVDASRHQAQGAPDSRNYVDVRERWIQGELEWLIGEDLALKVLPFHRRREDHGFDSSGFPFDFDFASDHWGVNSQLEYQTELLGRPYRATLGFDVLQEDRDADTNFGPNRARRKIYGAFWQSELALLDDLHLSFGARRDHLRYRDHAPGVGGSPDGVHSTRTTWGANTALTWRFHELASAYAAFERGFRFPNADELAGFVGFQPPLDPQKSENYELGLKLRSHSLNLNVALYHMNVHDEILFITGLQNLNVDRIRHRGVEVSTRVRPLERLELYGSYTYDDVEIQRDTTFGLQGTRIPLTPKHRGTLGATLHLPLGLEATLNANYVGARPVGNDIGTVLDPNGDPVDGLPKFATYDARLAWRRILREGVELQLEANGYNLTDREYTEVRLAPSFSVGFPGQYPGPDRHYLIGARITVTR